MEKNRRTKKLSETIDENLRRVYADTAKEPVPERFTKLLEQLRQQGEDKQKSSGDDS
ncbi:MAG: RNA polymerase sigma-70 factor [Roseovarius sp. BRH_c41]|jgi:hemerythrin-like domain-containing protein|nr:MULTISPECIES: NepR family anti-sigma factor [unclassified Roseovarius]EAQ26229.1 RNA polymerase sigma-70 factor [Roseovarius sp. 217]KJS40410.1 MAG: RNA polymerase sigma-70 factor [Roseovarius sp. BRH_c41]